MSYCDPFDTLGVTRAVYQADRFELMQQACLGMAHIVNIALLLNNDFSCHVTLKKQEFRNITAHCVMLRKFHLVTQCCRLASVCFYAGPTRARLNFRCGRMAENGT
jgi:hypothetical protein